LYEVVGVFKVIICVVLPFSYLNFANRGISASGGGMAYKAEFKKSNEVRFACGGSESFGKTARHRLREEWSRS
jgi:hypothetical protein